MHTFKRQTYSGQVVEFIKRCILDGELAPGEQVKEVTLSERLGISRAPIREALQILTQDGLITSEPQKGKYIRKMTRQEMARLAPRVGGLYEFTEVDDAFHSALLAHCANRRLVEMARSACTNISKFLFYNHWNVLFTPQEFVDRHRDIFEAVQTRNPATVEESLREHYRDSGRRMAQFGS